MLWQNLIVLIANWEKSDQNKEKSNKILIQIRPISKNDHVKPNVKSIVQNKTKKVKIDSNTPNVRCLME